MRRDSRLSGVLHVLLRRAAFDRPVASERLATVLGTNPVVVRCPMGTLRETGLVASGKGHGGGWRIAYDPARATLRDIHVALGSPDLIVLGNRAEALLLARLGADVHARMTERGRCGRRVLIDADA